jgi:ABC-type multidrug transport system permease subunit
MQALSVVLLVIVVTSSTLTVIQTYLVSKAMRHVFYETAFFSILIYLLWAFQLLVNFKGHADYMNLFLILSLLFEQGGVSHFSDCVLPKQLPSKNSLGLFYSQHTPSIFLFLVFFLAILVIYLGPFRVTSSNLQTILFYYCNIIIRVFFWIWKLMVLRKLSIFHSEIKQTPQYQ